MPLNMQAMPDEDRSALAEQPMRERGVYRFSKYYYLLLQRRQGCGILAVFDLISAFEERKSDICEEFPSPKQTCESENSQLFKLTRCARRRHGKRWMDTRDCGRN